MTNIQEENRKMVIMANNPDDENYEEALEMELELGCELLVNENILCYLNEEPIYNNKEPIFNKYILEEVKDDKLKLIGCDNLRDFNDIKIIGKPLMLDRVFIALKKYLNRDEEGHHVEPVIKIETCLYRNVNLLSYGAPDGEKYKLGVWDLSKSLDEQPEDTQENFNRLLKKGFNDNN